MRYCTCSRSGRWPSVMSRSKRERLRPALAAFLLITTGPSWQWSPTSTSCLTPSTSGMRLSGSVAWVASSMRHWRKRIEREVSRGSAAPTHVAQMTSAWLSSSFSAAMRSRLKIFSSSAESSPVSSRRRCSLCSAEFSAAASSFTWWCSVSCSHEEGTASRVLAHSLTTLRPVAFIFSHKWSTAMLDGAHTSVCPPCILTMW
mmetsp:Transcript_14058/g.35704  ORF Transcript_14058/g.35704 Transcript_14058/m.35704 type:complete len:202 (-) Transcript_14058:1481-2086(-)